MTYLTVPISAAGFDEAIRQVKAAKSGGAEAIELRTDYLNNLTVDLAQRLIADTRDIIGSELPLIVTCRDKREGGSIDYPLQLRMDVLLAAVKAGADFIDFEYKNFLLPDCRKEIITAIGNQSKTRLILSAHNFKGKFADIKKLYGDILASNPKAIPKLVYTANHINDCFEAFDCLHNARSDAIVLCMGEAGFISRIVERKLGGLISYASLNEKSATAPGQLTIERIKTLYRWDKIDRDTELYGIIGSPVGHSLSPLIHNSCFQQIGANKLYLPLLVDGDAEQFNEFLENCLARPWLDFSGFSVTIPHKENALRFVKDKGGFVEPLADKIGAVNTIIIERPSASDQRLIKAYNTDYSGALDAITAGMGIKREDLKGIPVVVIGAGGVARAIVAGLRDYGAKIKIYNRTVKRAEVLAKEFGCEFAGLDELPKLDAKLIINCTNIGMYPIVHSAPVPKELINKDMFVFDTVYNPAETLLLKQAKEVGAKTITGLDMFISQAAEQFELFTEREANIELMRKIVVDCLRSKGT